MRTIRLIPCAAAVAAMSVAATMATTPATAGGAEPPGVGSRAADFTWASLGGEAVTLSKELGRGPVVLVVLRGFPGYQCPLCTAQVADLARAADSIKSAGARVLMVYPGPGDQLKARAEEFLKGKALPENFEILLDPDHRFLNAYRLRWDAPGETSYPSTFVIDKDLIVRYARISRTHGGRSRATEVVKALKDLK